ncbi:MAG: hypothetical protein GF383_13725, partial [Candidatus Lokiarchaeota archaeon]|nr:hypothetical protein [Candidatus Lokiarchaeota archaeon]MBD3342319.1 hypothetical protein [Candidatus Lokiarchaeota archaeon]
YLIDLIEDGGGNIVIFDSWIGNNYFGQTFEEEIFKKFENPLDFLVYRFKKNKFSDHSIPHFLDNKTTQLLEYVKRYKKNKGKDISVINHIIKFCDHISIMSSFLKKKLQDKGIKILNLERDYSRANRGQLSTRIEAFLEMV